MRKLFGSCFIVVSSDGTWHLEVNCDYDQSACAPPEPEPEKDFLLSLSNTQLQANVFNSRIIIYVANSAFGKL